MGGQGEGGKAKGVGWMVNQRLNYFWAIVSSKAGMADYKDGESLDDGGQEEIH